VKVATVADPFGNAIGLLYSPHFRLGSAEVIAVDHAEPPAKE
jgi:hypothetical protein